MNLDNLFKIQKLARAARDSPATWDDRDCPIIALWAQVSPQDILALCDLAFDSLTEGS